VRILCKAGSDSILGATVVAADAGNMISEISLAIETATGLGTLAAVIHPYVAAAAVGAAAVAPMLTVHSICCFCHDCCCCIFPDTVVSGLCDCHCYFSCDCSCNQTPEYVLACNNAPVEASFLFALDITVFAMHLSLSILSSLSMQVSRTRCALAATAYAVASAHVTVVLMCMQVPHSG